MQVFRLSRERYAHELSGYGSSINGERWNSKGVEMVYTAMNRSLAMAEVAVHLSLASLPLDFMMLTIEIPDLLSIETVLQDKLPAGWNLFPHNRSTQHIGDEFIRNNLHCILKVPSVVTKGDFNFLINPFHKDFKKIKIIDTQPFPFDNRLFKS